MKTLVTLLAAVLLLNGSAFAESLVNVAGASRIAVNGYDPVAFFTEGKPVHGDPAIKAEYQGTTYLFANERDRALFTKAPEKYAPQFGGFCAFGISVGALFPVDISTWQVRDDRLYLNLNPGILKAFNEDFEGAVAKARENWPKLEKEYAK